MRNHSQELHAPISAHLPVSETSLASSQARLPQMSDSEDLISYFHSFERVACLNEIDESRWLKILPALLNERVRQHYNRLPVDICTDYRQTKSALLQACRMNSRFYLDKFKSMKRTGKQT